MIRLKETMHAAILRCWLEKGLNPVKMLDLKFTRNLTLRYMRHEVSLQEFQQISVVMNILSGGYVNGNILLA